MQAKNLDEYLTTYGPLLAKTAGAALDPIHKPAEEPSLDLSHYGVRPYPAQAHVSTALVKVLEKQDSVFLCGRQGVGKTKMAVWITDQVNRHRAGYRAIVMCPGQLVH